MFCRNCGQKITEDSKFCPYCGTKVEFAEAQDSAAASGESKIDTQAMLQEGAAIFVANDHTEENRYDEAIPAVPEEPREEAQKGAPEEVQAEAQAEGTGAPAGEARDRPKGKGKGWKRLGLAVAAVAAVGGIVLAAIRFMPPKIVPQDINTINGCPEFYGIEFGMPASEVSERVKLKHTYVDGDERISMPDQSGFRDAALLIDEEETFYLYGKRTQWVYVGFEGQELDEVLLEFSKDDVSIEEMTSLYSEIYGPVMDFDGVDFKWVGPYTTILVTDWEPISDDKEKSIIVWYRKTEVSKSLSLHFDGPELDPCGFLDAHYIFDKKASYYTSGLREGDDYTVKERSPEGSMGYWQYTLYPEFEYMGIAKGGTVIQFTVPRNREEIDSVSYVFCVGKNEAADTISEMYSGLTDEYGKYRDCYGLFQDSSQGLRKITPKKMIDCVRKGEEGTYAVSWEEDEMEIRLLVTFSTDDEYCIGDVSYSR